MWKNAESNQVVSQKMKVKLSLCRFCPTRSISTVSKISNQESKFNSLGNPLFHYPKDATNIINVTRL